jgi:DNA-binding response OmpR family regulator
MATFPQDGSARVCNSAPQADVEVSAHDIAPMEHPHREDAGPHQEEPLYPTSISVRDLRIDLAKRHVTRSGLELRLTDQEFQVLRYFVTHPNEVWSRDELLKALWSDTFVTPRIVDLYAYRLRKKIEQDFRNPSHLRTVQGAGYIFEIPRLKGQETTKTALRFGALHIDLARCRVTLSGKHIHLYPCEFRLLSFLASRPNKVWSRKRLLEAMRGLKSSTALRTVSVHVTRLRGKVPDDSEGSYRLQTVRRIGYVFLAPLKMQSTTRR